MLEAMDWWTPMREMNNCSAAEHVRIKVRERGGYQDPDGDILVLYAELMIRATSDEGMAIEFRAEFEGQNVRGDDFDMRWFFRQGMVPMRVEHVAEQQAEQERMDALIAGRQVLSRGTTIDAFRELD